MKIYPYVVALFSLVLATQVEAEVITKPVAYEHAGVKLQGFLAYDSAHTGSRPGVLVVPEWWGLNDFAKERAKALAALGYVAFAADMYGEGKTTADPAEAGKLAGPFYGSPLMAERARAGLDVLAKSPGVDRQRLAAIGFCFGGSTVQALGYTDAPLRGIVSFHGNPVMPPKVLPSPVRTKFLIFNGGADPMIAPEARASAEKALEDAHVPYQSTVFAGALHAFMNPNADAVAAKTGLTGKIGYNAVAAAHAWDSMKQFFSEVFAG